MSILLAAKGVKQVRVPAITANAVGVDAPQVAEVNFRPDGDILSTGNPPDRWYAFLSFGVGNDFEIYATEVSGSFSAGVFDSWLSLGSVLTWAVTAAGTGNVTGVVNFQIRRSGDTFVIASGDMTLFAEVVA